MSDSRSSSVLYRHVLVDLGLEENCEVLHGLGRNKELFFELMRRVRNDPQLVRKLQDLLKDNESGFEHRAKTATTPSSEVSVIAKGSGEHPARERLERSAASGHGSQLSGEVIPLSHRTPGSAIMPRKKGGKKRAWTMSGSVLQTTSSPAISTSLDSGWKNRMQDVVSMLCRTRVDPTPPSEVFCRAVSKMWSVGFRPFFLPAGSVFDYSLSHDPESLSLPGIVAPREGYWFLADVSKPTKKGCPILIECCSSGRSVRVGHQHETALSIISEIAGSSKIGIGRNASRLLSLLSVYEWRWFIGFCADDELANAWGLPTMHNYRGHMEWLADTDGDMAWIGKCGMGEDRLIRFIKKPASSVSSEISFRIGLVL